MPGEYMQPSLWQLTPEAQNQYVRSSMDQGTEFNSNQQEDDENTRQQREQDRRQQESRQIEPVQVNAIPYPNLRDVAKGVNNAIEAANHGGELTPEDYKFIQEEIFKQQPPENVDYDQRYQFQLAKSALNAKLLQVIPQAMLQPAGEREKEYLRLSEEVQEALRSADPRDAIEQIINRYETNDQQNYPMPVRLITQFCLDPAFKSTLEPERQKELRGLAEYAMEYATERIIGSSDDPERSMDPYPQPNLYQSASLDTIGDIARRFDESLQRDRNRPNFDFNNVIYVYLGKLRVTRQATHEIYRYFREGDKDQFKQGVAQFMGSTMLNFVENKIDGVSKAQRLYEKFYGQLISRHKGWSTAQEFGDLDVKMKGIFSESDVYLYDRDGIRYKARKSQMSRAVAEAGRMTAISERRTAYALFGDVPFSPVAADWLRSLEGEYLARSLAPLKMLPDRFVHTPGAINFMNKIKQNFRTEQGTLKYYGLAVNDDQVKFDPEHRHAKKKKELGLYGQDSDGVAILDTGNYDIKSSGWRSDVLFMRLSELKTIPFEGKLVTIGDFVDSHWRTAKAAHGHDEKAAQKMFDDAVRDVVSKERLSLAVLVRQAGINSSPELKKIIWQNIAQNLPSRIAAMLPGHTLATVLENQGILNDIQRATIISEAETTGKQPVDIMLDKGYVTKAQLEEARKAWDEIAQKIAFAEEERVENDYTYLRQDIPPEQKPAGIRPHDGLDDYLNNLPEGQKLDARQLAIVHEMQKIGHTRAHLFAKMTFPFTAFLDDAPRTDWAQFTGPDLRRAFSDNDAIEQGSGAIMSLIVTPGHRPEKITEIIHKAFEGYSQPLGVPDTQKRMAVYVEAYLELVKKNAPAKYFDTAMRLLRQPRSEIEEENLSSALAFDERGIASILKALAQEEIIADDPEHGGAGATMYMQLRKELGADRFAVLQMYVRILMMILGPVVAIQFLKAILPGDFAKVLAA